MTAQLHRAVVSVPANISEGHGRATTKSYIHHVTIGAGSLAEVETLIEIAIRLGFIRSNDIQKCQQLAGETSRMLKALIASLRKRGRQHEKS